MVPMIPRPVHGLIDYLYAAAVFASPRALGFADVPAAARLARLTACGVAGYSLLTRYEWGAVPVVPFRAHLAADAAGGLACVAAPWLAGFADRPAARNLFVAAGLFSVAAALLTDPTDGNPLAPEDRP